MKKHQHILRPSALITLGLLLALLSAAISQPVTVVSQSATGTPAPQVVTTTPEPINPAEIGSTNGLVFVSMLITIIILIPMFMRWKTWLRKP